MSYVLTKMTDIIEFNPRETIARKQVCKKVPMEYLQPFTRQISGFEEAPYAGGTKFRNNDTIMARITPCLENGKTAFVKGFAEDEVVFGSTEYIVMRAISGRSDPVFIYYLATSPSFREVAIKSMVGSSGRQRVQQDVLENLELVLPDYETQVRVGKVLASFDDKIELNAQINHNLEEQAKAIFKSWFVDFEPFGGVAPDNWQKGKLKNILSLQKRSIKAGISKDLPYLPIDSIPMRTFAITDVRPNSEAQSSLLLFDKDDILIGAMRVYFHRVIIAPFDGITRTTCFVLKPNAPAYLSFALLTCDLDSSVDFAQKTSKGSTMPYAVWDGGMGEIDILIPPLNIAIEFNSIVLPMLRKIQDSYREVYSLQKIRDTLLPKLMSGEIDVSEVQM